MLKTLKKHKWPYLFISPFFVLFLVFQLIPVVWTATISFTEWNGLNSPVWIGWDNYKLMMQDYMFRDALMNNLYYWIWGTILIMGTSLLVALCLKQEGLKGKRFFSTVTFLPYVCASVAMGLIFGMLFEENVGLVNEIIVHLGGKRIPWLNTSTYAKIPVLLLFSWRITPWFTVIIFSGLLNIPGELYEAATVDGAGPVNQFFHITLPLLGNILFFCMITITVDCWKMFNESFTLHGPGSSNMSLFQLVYQYAFKTFKLGYASAYAVVLIFILLAISLVQFKVRRKSGEL